MAKFRKRPVVIEAFRFTVPMEDFLPRWLADAMREKKVRFIVPHTEPDHLLIETIEGTHRADLGDWIVRGIQGELYPVKPDIFALTYEPADG